jgi:hypothetical protein
LDLAGAASRRNFSLINRIRHNLCRMRGAVK